MKLNVSKKNIHEDNFISENDLFFVFMTNDIKQINKKYDNVICYENVTYLNLSDYKYIVVVQKN